jgi:ketosteroid isomerase-like protein
MRGDQSDVNDAASRELRRRVHQIMQCRIRGDFGGMMQFFSPRVVVYYTCSKEGLFRPGVWYGRDAFRENMRLTDIDYQPLDGELKDVIVDGDCAAVRWRSVWRHVGTGEEYTLEMAHFLRWADDVVVEVHEFLDVLGFYDPIVVSMMSSLDDLLSPPDPELACDEIERRVEAVVQFSASGPDLELLRELCSPSIVCEFVGDRARIPYSGRHVGLQALVSIIRAIGVEFSQHHYETSQTLIDGGRVAMRRTVEWRHHGTGRRGLVYLADFARFEKGKLVELVEYRDSIKVLQMQGELEPA